MQAQAFARSTTNVKSQLRSGRVSARQGAARVPGHRVVRVEAQEGQASEEKAQKAEKTEKEQKKFTPPELDPNTPSPIFGGSTGGLLRMAQVEEFYVITWSSKKEQLFEMPTGGSAIMREGPNLLKLARKEQCLALLAQLRGKYRIDGQIYRVFPSGEVQYLHPKDGVYPEKVNKGRQQVNTPPRRIGENKDPAQVKFTGKDTFDDDAQ